MNVAGLTSDRGRNLLHVADLAPGGSRVVVILTDDPDASVLERAERRGIPTEVIDPTDLVDSLEAAEVDLVCLDGYDLGVQSADLKALPTVLSAEYGLAADDGSKARIAGARVEVVGVEGRSVVAEEPVASFEDDADEALRERVITQGAFRAYPRAIRYFAEGRVEVDAGEVLIDGDEGGDLPARYLEGADRVRELRYGENPHQDAAVYADYAVDEPSVVGAAQVNEGAKALSYNNYNDADAALALVREFDDPAAAVIKHTNPAGCAAAGSVADAYDRALATDPKSAFGGVVALNRECDVATAGAITDSFKEVVVAPGYADDALAVLREKENLRVLAVGELADENDERADWTPQRVAEKHLVGGRLLQERDGQRLSADDLEVVTERDPTDEQLETMSFAWGVVKHVKSNAIVFADGTETVGVGAGQVSRVDAVELAAKKADRDAEGKSVDGAVMASDAFFPFPDGVEVAAEAGVEVVVQPGGSVNDDDVIAACDELGLAMAFTGQRAFRHD